MRSLLLAVLAVALAGCPRPLPKTPAPADLAALDARLVQEPIVAFNVAIDTRGEPFRPGPGQRGATFRLGPGQRVEVVPNDGPTVVLDGAEARTRVVHYFLRRGAADLLETLTQAPDVPPPALPREVPGLRTGGWKQIDGDARGLLFPADGSETFLWLDDDSSLPLRRDNQRLRAFDTPPPPVEIYSDWTFGG